jgi:hypothetical protein
MSDYPEHDKLTAVADETQAAGDFVNWLAEQGIQLMTWRENLTDTRPASDECRVSADSDSIQPCDQTRDDGTEGPVAWWRRHCKHWQDAGRPAEGDAKPGHCCRCGNGQFTEIHGVRAWTDPGRNLTQLLADWQGIDLRKINDEKRRMLAALRGEG